MNILVFRMRSMDCHDIRPSNSNVHDDYNLVCKWHFVHSLLDYMYQHNYDLCKIHLVHNHYPNGIQLEIFFFRMEKKEN